MLTFKKFLSFKYYFYFLLFGLYYFKINYEITKKNLEFKYAKSTEQCFILQYLSFSKQIRLKLALRQCSFFMFSKNFCVFINLNSPFYDQSNTVNPGCHFSAIDAHRVRGGERHLMYPLKILQKNLVIKMQKNTKIEDPLFSHNQP
jgi:hypothetical protein